MKADPLCFEQDICLAFATVYSCSQEDWEDSEALLSDLGTIMIHEQTLQNSPYSPYLCSFLYEPVWPSESASDL